MDYVINETFELARIVLGDRKTGFIEFTGTRPVIIADTTALEVWAFHSLKGRLSAAEFQELRPHIRRVEDLELDRDYVRVVNEDGSSYYTGRTPDEGPHTAEQYFRLRGSVIETDEVPLGSLWGTVYRRFNGETFAFDLLGHPYRLAEYGRIPLAGTVPVTFYWAERDVLSIRPVLEIWFGFCRFFSVGI